jgi:hypothetical protein
VVQVVEWHYSSVGSVAARYILSLLPNPVEPEPKRDRFFTTKTQSQNKKLGAFVFVVNFLLNMQEFHL